MSPKKAPRWPKLVFWNSLGFLLLAAAISAIYYSYNERAREQQAIIDSKTIALKARVALLERQRQVTQVIEQQVPYTVTHEECFDLPFPFGQKNCISVPRVETRTVPTKVVVEDPAVSAERKVTTDELARLSQHAAETTEKRDRVGEAQRLVRTFMTPILSLLVVLSSLFVILSKRYGPESEKWAFGSVGTVLGFWLK